MKLFNEYSNLFFGISGYILYLAELRKVTLQDVADMVVACSSVVTKEEIESYISSDSNKLLRDDGTTVLKNNPSMPLTIIQKRWLKAISLDPRFKLFGEELEGLDDVEPLYTAKEYEIYDKFKDGDPYEKETYIKNFMTVVKAIKEGTTLNISVRTRSGHRRKVLMLPSKIEYSDKDDKFRVFGSGDKVNMKNIITAEKSEKKISHASDDDYVVRNEVVFRLINPDIDEMMNYFSHFAKEVRKVSDTDYEVKIFYLPDDETEIMVRLFAFGPSIQVLAPSSFREAMKSRISKQMRLFDQ